MSIDCLKLPLTQIHFHLNITEQLKFINNGEKMSQKELHETTLEKGCAYLDGTEVSITGGFQHHEKGCRVEILKLKGTQSFSFWELEFRDEHCARVIFNRCFGFSIEEGIRRDIKKGVLAPDKNPVQVLNLDLENEPWKELEKEAI